MRRSQPLLGKRTRLLSVSLGGSGSGPRQRVSMGRLAAVRTAAVDGAQLGRVVEQLAVYLGGFGGGLGLPALVVVAVEDALAGFFHRVGHDQELEVFGRYLVRGEHDPFYPVDEALPVFGAEEDEGEI